MNIPRDKYFSILGDSISTYEGYLPQGYPSYYCPEKSFDTGVYGARETWWGQVIDKLGGRLLVNNSYSGSYVCKAPRCEIGSYGCSDARALGLDDGVYPDHILIYIGTNDRGAGFRLYSEDKDDLSVIENAYRTMLLKIKGKYKDAEIWCLTLPITSCSRDRYFVFPKTQMGVDMREYGRLIRRAAKDMGCHIIELEDEGRCCDTVDGLHPNFAGMEYIANRVISAMLLA